MNIRCTWTIILLCISVIALLPSCIATPDPTPVTVKPAESKENSVDSTAKVAEIKQSIVSVSSITLSNDYPIESDNISVTAKISNTGNQTGSYKSEFYIDKNLKKSEDIQVEPGQTIESNYTILENSACMHYIENGGQGKLVVFHPVGNPDSINRTSFTDYNNIQPAVTFGKGRLVLLKENINAKKPTYSQVIDFLKSKNYSADLFDVETLHNDAEAAGIRCAFVWWEAEKTERTATTGEFGGLNTTIQISNADVFDAFQTTDKGLVFAYPKTTGYIFYIEKGKPVGLIDLQNALYPDYSYFEKYFSMVDSEGERLQKLFPGKQLMPSPIYYKLAVNTGKCDFYW